MSGCSSSRETAYINTASRNVGTGCARTLRYNGASIETNGSGTNSVMPRVQFAIMHDAGDESRQHH
jgi:hypothetical protein